MNTALSHIWSGLSLLALCVAGCDRTQPLEPSSQPLFRTADPPTGMTTVAVSESRIDVSWLDNSANETGFELYRSTAGGGFMLRAKTGPAATSYADVGLTMFTQYCYRVRSFRVRGPNTSYSQFSAISCATTPTPPPPPGPPNAPSYLDARAAASTTINVLWFDNANNEDGFRIERSLDNGASWVTAGTHPASYPPYFRPWLSIVDDGRESEVSVCYRVIAFNADGESPPSTTDCATPVAAPSDLLVTPVDDQTVTLTWTDNSNVEEGYEVALILDLSGYWETIAILPANTTSFQAPVCSGGAYGCYGYAVAAVKEGAYSDWAVIYTVP